MSVAAYQNLLAVALGFALSGMLTTGHRVVMFRPPSYRLLGLGIGRPTLSALPFLTFAAPFIIMRNTVRRRGLRHNRFLVAMTATIVAGTWSLLSGSAVVFALRLCGLLST